MSTSPFAPAMPVFTFATRAQRGWGATADPIPAWLAALNTPTNTHRSNTAMTTITAPTIERPDFTMVAENKERPELGITGIRHHPDGCKGTTRWSPRPGTAEEIAKTRPCSMCIKSLAKGVTAPPAPAQSSGARRNRFAGTCTTCGRQIAAEAGLLEKDAGGAWIIRHDGPCPQTDLVETQVVHSTGLDLSALPTVDTQDAMHFGVLGGDTRLKIRVRRPSDGKYAGWIFVDDGAVYGEGQRYGRQLPGQKYSGDIEAALAAILADPMGALRRYAELTNRCGVCNRPLENAESVARGIGPVCAREMKF